MGQVGLESAEGRAAGGLSCGPLTKAEARRERLIATARVLFAEHGFHATGIAQIARRSGVAVGQIYRDFANKEEIVAAIVERDLSASLDDEALRRAVDGGDATAVRQWVRHFLSSDKDETTTALVAEIVAEQSRNERIAVIFHTVQERLRTSIAGALEVLAPEPAKAPRREMLCEMILTISAGLFHRRLGAREPLKAALVATLSRSVEREMDALVEG